ncbi:non-homologous end joining protein Ku [Nitratireductor aestuarii]|uniref:Non-homologous end joining protein Ku n=1 Tax=Nitratireductor aestuarii TaxID=1735103 RepID=A0A916RFY2_9HYPH|nr:Ku protein [Nitratireductor aestuarii]GGA55600.1 non-homologous end joining protein Ku [Nitratireductor aestuarii]
MAPRATWKGYIKLAELALPISLYAGATTSKRISFHIINRKTGNRVSREYIDEDTSKVVDREHQVKGYETGEGQYIILHPDEIAAALPNNDKTITIEGFVPAEDVDTVFFDKPYYLASSGGILGETFAVLCEGMKRQKVAAVGKAVLFKKARTLILRPEGEGLVANTLNYDYEVRLAEEIFKELPEMKIEGEMLDLAKHIIETKMGSFDPRSFDDRYDQALADLIKAKAEGKEIKVPPRKREAKVVNLLDALRESAKAAKAVEGKRAASNSKAASTRRKAS